MKKFKNIFLSLIAAVMVLTPFIKASAAEPINIYLFYGDGCPHCESAMEYLEGLDEETRSKFNLIKYEVWYNSENSTLMSNVANLLKTSEDNLGVPYIIIGDQTIVGFAENYSEDSILAAIDAEYNETSRYDIADKISLEVGSASEDSDEPSYNTGSASGESSSSDLTTIIALAVIVVGVVGLLVFAKIKSK